MIKILKYEPCQFGSKIGVVDISVDIGGVPFIMRQIAHLKKGEREWFDFPKFSHVIESGYEGGLPKKIYLRYMQYANEDTNNQLLRALHEEVKQYLAEHSVQTEASKAEQLALENKVEEKEEDIPF